MKIETINNRTTLIADEGKRVTDGADICGKTVHLALDRTPEGFYEIDEAEYLATLAEEQDTEILA